MYVLRCWPSTVGAAASKRGAVAAAVAGAAFQRGPRSATTPAPWLSGGGSGDGSSSARSARRIVRVARGQGLAHGALHGAPHHPRLGEAHLRLRGMDVDVDHVRRRFEEEDGLAAELAAGLLAIGVGQRAGDAAVADRTAVHVQAHGRARGAGAVGPGDEAAHPRPALAAVHRDEVVEHVAEELEHPLRQRIHRRAPG